MIYFNILAAIIGLIFTHYGQYEIALGIMLGILITYD